jgi:signal transduction histidine kinase
LELKDVLQALVDVAVDILKADKSLLMVWDSHKRRLIAQAARGFKSTTLAEMSLAPDECLIGRVATTGQPITVQDTLSKPEVTRQLVALEGIRSSIHVPITIGDEIFGVFTVSYTRPYAFSEADQRLTLALAQRTALAIQNAKLYEQAQHAATVEERQRIARELHDAVTQTLFSASIIADVLPRLWEINPQEAIRRVQELRELTRGAMAEMRTLLLELRPTALKETPIDDLLHQLGEATTGRARVPVHVSSINGYDLPQDVKVALYRIAQEALNNVAKHSGASQAEVILRYIDNDHAFELCIRDDGQGFNPQQVRKDHMGLHIMHERAEAIGATLSIHGQPGQGTQIIVRWELPEVCA